MENCKAESKENIFLLVKLFIPLKSIVQLFWRLHKQTDTIIYLRLAKAITVRKVRALLSKQYHKTTNRPAME
ncbi:hypothetical protein [Bartonella sp. CL71SXKL]|uniref:hypothetical protein n=1 Tax=Bartonella sp. CL71SXKL TaxID=3243540 RepID=UPI0035CF7238